MPYTTPFDRPVTVATAAANVNSTSFQIGDPNVGRVFTNILCPHALHGVSTVKVQVSKDNVTFYDILSDGIAVVLSCVIDSVLPIPDSVQAGMAGFDFMRLVANANPDTDIVFQLRFAVMSDENPIVDDDVIWGSRTSAAVTDPALAATQMSLLKGMLTELVAIAGGAVTINANVYTGKSVTVTPTLTVAGAYSSGDYVGTSGVAMDFNVARIAGKDLYIDTITIVDKAKQDKALEIWFFNADPTPPADNAAWDITDAHALFGVGVVPLPAANYADNVSNSIVTVNTKLHVMPTGASTHIYAVLIARDTPTYANGDLQVTIAVTQN